MGDIATPVKIERVSGCSSWALPGTAEGARIHILASGEEGEEEKAVDYCRVHAIIQI